jgi:protease I
MSEKTLKLQEICMKNHVMILATDGFEQSELMKPKALLEDAGFETSVVSLQPGQIKGWDEKDWGENVAVDRTVDEVRDIADYSGLLIPGGQINPDLLRVNEKAVELVRDFVNSGKPVAAICHSPWVLIEAGVMQGRKATSYKSIRTDLRNAGAIVHDREMVQDGNIITSRNPDDIPAFTRAFIAALGEGATGETKIAEEA